MSNLPNNRKQGYITLIIVLVVSVVSLSITLSLLHSGLASSRSSLSYQQMYQAENMTRACTEEALQKIRENTLFTGTNTLVYSLGSCSYTVTNTGGNTRAISSQGTVNFAVRKMQTNVNSINPLIIISSWQDV
jgi:Tfp pilus assembly protein PilX